MRLTIYTPKNWRDRHSAAWFWDRALDFVDATNAAGVIWLNNHALEICIGGFPVETPKP